MGKTAIKYVDHACNPYGWHCEKLSPGCANCYMFRLANQYGHDADGRWKPGRNPAGPFTTRFEAAEAELDAAKPGETVFLNDMSDTYHRWASDRDVDRVHQMAVNHPDLIFMIVTKRPERAYYMRHRLAWPGNLWLMVSVETAAYLWRVVFALLTPAKHVGISAEPLLGPLPGKDLWRLIGKPSIADPEWYTLSAREQEHLLIGPHTRANLARYNVLRRVDRGIEWIITGGESGPGHRPFDLGAVRGIIQAVQPGHTRHVCIFHKQGSANLPGQDRLVDGVTWDEIPVAFGGKGPVGPTLPASGVVAYQMALL